MESSKWVAIAATVVCCGLSAKSQSVFAQDTTGTIAGSSDAIAKVAGRTVTDAELTSFSMQLEMSEARRVPSREALLDEYILTQLYDQIPTTATIEADSGAESPSPYDLVTQRTVLKRKLRDALNESVEVPREDMEKWFEANASRYTKPERVHAWHLFLETSDEIETSSPEKVRSRLKDLKGQIDEGTSFSETAEMYSEAASGKAGGEIGMITRRMPIGPLSKPMNIELEDAFFSLPVGKVSDVVETRHGMHLLYVTDRETTKTPTVDDLITSGILPGVLAQDRLTSEIRGIVAETVKKYNGTVLPGLGEDEEITTQTVAFSLGDKQFSVGDLESVFGPRFTNYLQSAREDRDALRDLLQQALDDEAMVQAAIDQKLDQDPEVSSELKTLEKRAVAAKKIDAIVSSEAAVTEGIITARYDQLKDELRQPVAEGFVLMIQSDQASGTAEQARAREVARRKAEEIRQRLETQDFEQVVGALESDDSVQTTYSEVAQHIIGQSTDTLTRIFDQAISGISGQEGLSQAVPVGADFAIAQLVRRAPGEPVALEVIRDRLVALIEGELQAEARENLVKRLQDKGLVEFLPGAVAYGKPGPDNTNDEQTSAPH